MVKNNCVLCNRCISNNVTILLCLDCYTKCFNMVKDNASEDEFKLIISQIHHIQMIHGHELADKFLVELVEVFKEDGNNI